MYYCRINGTRGGFFDTTDHGKIGSPNCTIPQGAKEITDEQHAELMAAVDNGKLIVPDADGYPIAVDPWPPTADEAAATERVWRDQRLSETDSMVTRHRDELESSGPTTLTAEQYTLLQDYRRQLRNWPEGAEFPLVDHRPVAPPWLTGSRQ